jgi:hypothetical protein
MKISHWTKVKTKLSNKEYLKKALGRMGLTFEEGNHTITQYGTSEAAQIKLDNAVGFSVQKDGTFAMVGDFYHSNNPKLRKYYSKTNLFNSDLTTAYAVEEATSRLEEQSFFCSENEAAEVSEDGLIRMVFNRY